MKLETITQLEKANPPRIMEFCYEFGCPTEWFREPLTENNLKREYVQYKCEACHEVKKYPLRHYVHEKGGKTS